MEGACFDHVASGVLHAGEDGSALDDSCPKRTLDFAGAHASPVPAIRIPSRSAEPLAVDVHLEEPEQGPAAAAAAAEQAERSSPAEQDHPEVRCPVRSSFGDAAAPDQARAPSSTAGPAGRQEPSQAQHQQQRREQQHHLRPQPLDIPGASSGAHHQQRQGTFPVGSPTVTAPIVPQIRRTLSGGACTQLAPAHPSACAPVVCNACDELT